MNRLNDEFADEIDFFYLDVDHSDTMELVLPYGVRARSTYVLLDANGERVTFWTGPLNEEVVQTKLAEFLTGN